MSFTASVARRGVVVVLIACASAALGAAPQPARKNPAAPAPKPPVTLETARTAYVLNQTGEARPYGELTSALNKWHRWSLVDRADAADLVVTLETTSTAAKVSGNRTAAPARATTYAVSVHRSTRATGDALWRGSDANIDRLFNRLRVDVAPSLCFAVWCR